MATEEKYFVFTLLNDGTYEIAAADVDDMPPKVEIPASHDGLPVTRIGDWAFSKRGGLVSVTIPDSVTSIGDCAFNICTGLISIVVPSSVMSIGWGAFAGCSGLMSATIPAKINDIFSGCSNLTSITFIDK